MKRNKVNIEEIVSYILGLEMDELADITRYRIASRFGINKNYLSYKFKKHTKMSVLQFIDFVKINRAAALLRERQDMAINDISKKIGIINGHQFRIKFKKKFFINPSQYRILNKK